MLPHVREALLNAAQQHHLELAREARGEIDVRHHPDSGLAGEALAESGEACFEGCGCRRRNGCVRRDEPACLAQSVARGVFDEGDRLGGGILSPCPLGQHDDAREALRDGVMDVAGETLALGCRSGLAVRRFEFALRSGELGQQTRPL